MAPRSRNSEKSSEKENRTGQNGNENANNHKLPDNPDRNPEELISTRGDTSNGKDSKTGKRKEDIDKDYTRGGK